MNRENLPTAAYRSGGFSLVELMVAMTLGLIVVGAVGYVYLGSRAAFRTTDNMSRMQESGRYALDAMSREVRMAGYVGCGNLQTATVNTIANPPVPVMSSATAVTGQDFTAAAANFLGTTITRPAGDTLSIMAAFGGGVPLVGNLAPSNAQIQIAGNPYGFAVGDVLMVTDCKTADIFRPTTVSGGGTVTMSHANSTNTGNRVGNYGSDGIVFKMQQFTYFIGINPATNNRALYRTEMTTGTPQGTQEIVEHVEDMQITYGLDTNGDRAVDAYASAAGVANWAQVVAVRISLLVSSPENNITTSNQTYIFNAAAVNATDRRMYQTFTATIGVRNRLP